MQTDAAPSTTPDPPEVAKRLRDRVFSLEGEFQKLEDAARTGLALAIASGQKDGDIPPDLLETGIEYMFTHLVDHAMALRQGYRELFALAVKGVLPEQDPDCREGGEA